MDIRRIDHVSGKGSYVVLQTFGRISRTAFGPATLSECERFIRDSTITEQPAPHVK